MDDLVIQGQDSPQAATRKDGKLFLRRMVELVACLPGGLILGLITKCCQYLLMVCEDGLLDATVTCYMTFVTMRQVLDINI